MLVLFSRSVFEFSIQTRFCFVFSLTCTKCYLNDKDRRQALKKKTKQNLTANKPHYDEGSLTDTQIVAFITSTLHQPRTNEAGQVKIPAIHLSGRLLPTLS